ncbi:hypothetical protein LEP1GSC170_0102 [Leptospira interrogans serovar Bataviae str. HAI135]|nr:hypothetical protein LEP1GSC170_0102 [Leptospira interrogans serovar Bataviae str. HAI135]
MISAKFFYKTNALVDFINGMVFKKIFFIYIFIQNLSFI